MNEIITKEDNLNIEDMIYEVRGKQVMLDSDLAKLYKCANGTKTINLAVRRHINRFPERFMFQLTKEEYYDILRFQSETLELEQGKYSKYLPYAFTEQGTAMLATIIRTEVAENVSIRIMDAFVAMHKYISANLLEQKYINNIVMEDHEKITKINNDVEALQTSFQKFEEKRKINEIYFNGQIYDAYSKIVDILKEAKKEIIIIDSYADKTILDMISKLNTQVILITKENNKLSELDISKYHKQYHNLEIIYNNTFHDRYIILDNSTVYHLGTSINHAGSKTFSVNILTDKFIISSLLNYTVEIISKGGSNE